MAPIPLPLLAALATIASMVISIAALSYKIGRWMQDIESDHEDMVRAHSLLHEDMEKVVNHTNGFDSSNREHCYICEEAKDME